MDVASSPQVTWTISSNPIEGHQKLAPRKDAADPDYFFRKDGRQRTDRDPEPTFFRLANLMLAQRGFRTDAALTAAFARSMEHRIAKVYAIEFARYRFREFFPVSTEVDPGARSFSYRMLERFGNAGLISDGNARDLPRVSVGGQETQMPVVTYGAAYGFNIIDEKSASLAQIALEDELAKATREAIEKFADAMAAVGLTGTGIVCVTNAPGVAAVAQQSISAGTWQAQLATIAGATTSNATPPAVVVAQAIAMDLLAMKQQIAIRTLERQEATDCLLPTNLYQMLDGIPRSPGYTDDTLLEYLEKLTGLEISSWNALQNAGNLTGSKLTLAGGATQKTRIVVYDKDPEVVQYMEAQPFVQLAPQLAGLEYTVPCYERSGGIMAVRPLGVVYMDGC